MPLFKKKFELSPRLRVGVGRGLAQNRILKFGAVICLVLALGLAVNAVRLIFSGIPQSSTASNDPQVLGASDTKNNSSNLNIELIDYKVAKGDTLFNIAQKFNISWTTLATLNNITSPFILKPGKVLKVPKN